MCMRLAVFLLFLLGLMWTSLIWAVVTGDRSAAHQPHPAIFAVDDGGKPQAAMLVAADSAANDRDLAGPGYLYGATMIILFVVCILMSTEDAQHRHLLQTLVVLGGIVFLATFTYMFWSWTSADAATFVGPFPRATTWMVFGVTTAPMLFGAVYVIGYRHWYHSTESASEA